MSTPSTFKGTGGFDATNQKVIGLADATNPQDALNLRTFDAKNTVTPYNTAKPYAVDFVVEFSGQLWKCVAATTGAFDKTKWTAIKGSENWIRITGAYTAAAMDSLVVDTTASALSITLPALPKSGDYVTIVDAGNADINNITVVRNGSSIGGVAADLVLNESAIQVTLVYLGGTWILNIERQKRVKFVSSSVTVESNVVYALLIASGFNVTLPQAPKAGDWVSLIDRNGTAGVYPITINGGVKQIDGNPTFMFNQKKAAYQFIYNGTGWVSFMLAGNALLADKNLSDLVDPSAARGNLGLGTAATQTMGTGAAQIRTNAQNDLVYQPLDQTLTAIAALVTAADKLTYSTGLDTFAQTDFPLAARTFLAATTPALQRSAMGLGSAATANIGTAAGNVMSVGSFGLGSDMAVGGTDLNTYRAGGFYQTPATGLTNLPSGWSQAVHSVIVAGSATGSASQIIMPISVDAASGSRIAIRWSPSPGSWSAWAILSSGLGTASTRDVGLAAGNVMEVGAFGWGATNVNGPVVVDLNTLRTVGVSYTETTSANAPIAEAGFVMTTGADAGANKAIQTFRSTTSNRIFERRLNTTWSAWVEMLHSGNAGTAAYATIGTSNGNVMPVGAGGWLSGAVVAQTLDVNTLVTTQTLYVHSGSTNIPLVAFGQLFHLQYGDTNYAMQKFFAIGGVEYVRYKAGTWGAWTQTVTLASQYPAWTNATYQNGWTDFSTSYNSAGYRKEGNRVFFRGVTKNASNNPAALFTLPTGFRPIKAKLIPLSTVVLTVDVTGAVTISSYTATAYLMLDSLSFEID